MHIHCFSTVFFACYEKLSTFLISLQINYKTVMINIYSFSLEVEDHFFVFQTFSFDMRFVLTVQIGFEVLPVNI